MSEQPHHAIVVDTSVARSASGTENPLSIQCRETLDTLSSEGYDLAMSDPIWDEWNRPVINRPEEFWNKYASRYAMEWYLSMESRGRVHWVYLQANSPLKDQTLATTRTIWPNSHVPEDIEKDFPLVETALSVDHRIISLNNRERLRFQRIAVRVRPIQSVFWIDPQRENVPNWLHEGAQEDESLRLKE